MDDERIPPRDSEDPRERDLSRRSGNTTFGVTMMVALALIIAAVVYTALYMM